MWLRLAGLDEFASFINGVNRDFCNIMGVAGKWVATKDHEVGLCTNF
jgi:hypothetical protein